MAAAGGIGRTTLLLAAGLGMVLGAVHAADPGGRWGCVVAAVTTGGIAVWAAWRGAVTRREVLVGAVVLRLLALPLVPGLSDDGFRYVWDGWVQASGYNPFAYVPSDPALWSLQNRNIYEQLNSASYFSVYPPGSQIVFRIGALAGTAEWEPSWYLIKLSFVVLEFAGIWALSHMVAARWLVLYAWHPLAVLEVAGQAHTEAGMVGMLLLGLWAVRKEQPGWAAAAVTAAGWFKLYPFLLLPFLLRRVGWRYLGVVGAVSLALVLPYAAPYVIPHVGESLGLYVRLFEFNAGPYFVLKELVRFATGHDFGKLIGPVLQGLFLLSLPFVYRRDARVPGSLAHAWLVVLGLFLATATTVHPWYLLGVLALLPVVLHEGGREIRFQAAAWVWLSLASLGTYLFYTHGSGIYWVSVILGWTGWALLMGMVVLPVLMRHRGRRKWAWIRTYLPERGRLLDLGAGEGYVGLAAAADGREVVLADVADLNRTPLPLVRYDGRHLPFEPGAFDAVVLVFVLHHAEDPEAALREARRVAGTTVVVESVVETRWDRWWLPRADRAVNRLRGGAMLRAQEEHLAFRSAERWRETFRGCGFEVVAEERRGRLLHKQHLFALRPLL